MDALIPSAFLRRVRRVAYWLPLLLVITSLACALPFSVTPTPTDIPTATPTTPPTPTPTATPQPLPPALVESDPPVNSELPLNGPITLYFNQPMDRGSVEAGLSVQMGSSLAFSWIDDSTVIVYLSQPLRPEMALSLNLSDSVKARSGKPLLQTIRLDYQAAGYLQLIERIPAPEAMEVDPSGAIIASFNRPIVPLGADPASLPAGFTVEPAAPGRGEWLNTSTYIFYPQPGLAGGQRYTVQPNPDLQSTDGGPLQAAGAWGFTTARPMITAIEPSTEIGWPLDPTVQITFNQPMDAASLEANFRLLGPGGVVAGQYSWNDSQTVLTFKPQGLLGRGTIYTLQFGQALSAGGTPLEQSGSPQVMTVPALSVANTDPAPGQELEPHTPLTLYFRAPVRDENLAKYMRLEPAVSDLNIWSNPENNSVYLSGSYEARTTYTLRISPDLPDRWGGTLGQEYVYTFTTGPLQPNLSLPVAGSSAIFLTTQDTSVNVQVANVPEVPLTVGRVQLNDFFALNGPGGYELADTYRPSDAVQWVQPLSLTPDRMETTQLFLNQERAALAPGIYHLRFNFPNQPGTDLPSIFAGPYYVVVSDLQVTLKAGTSDALVWVIDLRTNAPVANAPVTLYDETGSVLAQGQTDDQGIYQAGYVAPKDIYTSLYAMVSQPGDTQFGMAITGWNQGIDPYEFGIRSQLQAPGPKVYLYSDRPMYRPGQTVYFRAVVRQADNGRYSPAAAAAGNLPVEIFGTTGSKLTDLRLSLTAFGTAHGEYVLPDDAEPGSYSINSPLDPNTYLNFQVADYRKPEINLQAAFDQPAIQAGETLAAAIDARYFFDAPAGGLKAHWALYANPGHFRLPGYQVGLLDTSWLDAFRMPENGGSLGRLVKEGDGQTGPDGKLAIQAPTEPGSEQTQYTLEVTLTDESGLPVSARATAVAHPGGFYIGVRPDTWSSRAGELTGFEVQAVDWQQNPTGGQSLHAEFRKVVWNREDRENASPYALPTFVPVYTPVGNADFVPGADGKARLAFTPPEPGTYQLDLYDNASGPDQGAHTQTLIWVGGPGQTLWPNLPNARLHLTANQDAYRPGDIAQVFIPNPFGQAVQALLAVERSKVMSYQVVSIPAEGYNFNLPLTNEHAPNVYLSVTMIGRNQQSLPDFRQGYVNLPVQPVAQQLNVTLLGQPERAGPGDTVSFEIQVTDAAGSPVQGEFSLAVVDLAALALAEPNSEDILTAFYGEQPNGVRTSLSLAAYARRLLDLPGGMGGGGDGSVPSVTRENFPDTAYWNAEVVTGADGKAQVTVQLPDTLTTWQVEARGLTSDTRVGQGTTQVITSKALLIRPVTPRFLVVNDHAQVAAVVQNNTGSPLQVDVALQASGFTLDENTLQSQAVQVPAQGRVRVEWWGTAQDVEAVDLVFSARSGDLEDAAKPALGALPVLRYVAPQTFRTAGAIEGAGSLTELVSLPRSYQAQGGALSVELSPSLAAAMLQALEALESAPYESTEQVVSNFLPNLETYRTLQQFNTADPALQARLDRSLNQGLQRLTARQNMDGGWSWWHEDTSDPYITTYVLFGLTRARQAGITINQDMIQRAVQFLQEAPPRPAQAQGAAAVHGLQAPARGGGDSWPPEPWGWDRVAFREYVLSQNGGANPELVNLAYQNRDQLSPWALALLAQTLDSLSAGSPEAKTILDDLQTAAVRSATGAAWEMKQDESGLLAAGYNMHSNLSNTAIVLYVLAQRDPASPLVADALRYLMANRQPTGGWSSTYTSAWSLIALNQVAQSTGELSSEYAYSATLNGNLLAEGRASGTQQVSPVVSQTPIQRLYPDYPNVLTLNREGGVGRLYYTVGLNVSRPAKDVTPLSQGLTIERAVLPFGQDCSEQQCLPLTSAQARQKVTVRLSLTVPNDRHYVAVQDYIPAGAEILDTRLLTSQLGIDGEAQTEQVEDPRQPGKLGWGWERFSTPQVYDDHITWTAPFLPAGTYELTYTLVLLQPGQFQVRPATAWQLYFPEVYGNSAGSVFEIQP